MATPSSSRRELAGNESACIPQKGSRTIDPSACRCLQKLLVCSLRNAQRLVAM